MVKTSESTSAAVLAVSLLGRPECRVHGKTIHLPSRRSMWVLSMLALRQGESLDRQNFAESIWPDSSPEAALFNFRQTLAGIRKALGEAGDLIQRPNARSICLADDERVWIDAREFDRLRRNGSLHALEEAIAMRRGVLMEGCEELFVLQPRFQYDEAFLAMTANLSATYETLGDSLSAANVLRKAIQVNPHHEATYRNLMELFARTGEQAQARETYQSLRRILRRDLGLDPDPVTREVYRTIRLGHGRVSGTSRFAYTLTTRRTSGQSELIGRAESIREIRALLDRCRLVTLTGVGGVGKTSLAHAVGDIVLDDFVDGVKWVDLTSVSNPGAIDGALAAALSVADHPGQDLLTSACRALTRQDCVIVMDNCEHLMPHLGQTIDTLLTAAGGLRILATSRRPLHISGEVVWRVPTLAWQAAASPSEEDSNWSDALRLFISRAQQAGALRDPSQLDGKTITAICARLEGIPLAIELAAARTKVLSLKQIESRLDQGLNLLVASGSQPDRHQTMEAAIRWSWEMLSAVEQIFLSRLSIFRAGASIEALQFVTGTPDENEALNVLSNLVDQSVLFVSPEPLGSRLSMLEPVRQFAYSRLEETGNLDLVRDRFRDYYLGWLEETGRLPSGPEERALFDRLERDHENIRLALDWCHEKGDHELALRLASQMCRFWDTAGHVREGRSRMEFALSQVGPDCDERLRANAHGQVGWIASVQNDWLAALEHYSEAEAFNRAFGTPSEVANFLLCLATAVVGTHDLASAKSHLEEAISLYQDLERPSGVAIALHNLAEIAILEGDLDNARQLAEEALDLSGGPHGGTPHRRRMILATLATTELKQGEHDQAMLHTQLALAAMIEGATLVSIPNGLSLFGILSARMGDYRSAATITGASVALSQQYGTPMHSWLEMERQDTIGLIQAQLGLEEFNQLRGQGAKLTAEQAVELVQAWRPIWP